MTSEGLGKVFECDSADRWARKFPLVSMGGLVGSEKTTGIYGSDAAVTQPEVPGLKVG